jgi:hypothetical protein
VWLWASGLLYTLPNPNIEVPINPLLLFSTFLIIRFSIAGYFGLSKFAFPDFPGISLDELLPYYPPSFLFDNILSYSFF